MKYTKEQLWVRFQKYYSVFPGIGLSLDISRMNFTDAFLDEMEPKLQKAFSAMQVLEKGAIANPDENRMVGHYWLRNPELAPNKQIAQQIEQTVREIKVFTEEIHSGKISNSNAKLKNV
ncbi:MAG TPA: glucose-6-phosphate isomerase, partial [Verrucomicrobiae bacterium]